LGSRGCPIATLPLYNSTLESSEGAKIAHLKIKTGLDNKLNEVDQSPGLEHYQAYVYSVF
jgi:hypothetical protein